MNIDALYERVDRTPRGGLVAITMAEVAEIMYEHPPYACPRPWPAPSTAKTTLLGVHAIVIDRPPLPFTAADAPWPA